MYIVSFQNYLPHIPVIFWSNLTFFLVLLGTSIFLFILVADIAKIEVQTNTYVYMCALQ